MKVILESEDREYLLGLVRRWFEGIDTPDDPLVGIAGTPVVLSPRQLVQAVQDKTDIGDRYIQNLADVVARSAFEDVTRKTFRR